MNRRKARFSRPVKVSQVKVETPSDEEDQCSREEQPPPPPYYGKYRINLADTPITPPLTPPRHVVAPSKAASTATSTSATELPLPSPPQQERSARHVPAVPRPPPLLPPAPVDEHTRTVHMLLTVPPPPPPSVPPPPPPPPVVPSRQLNRLPPPPGARYGPPTTLPSPKLTPSAHPPSLEDQQQQRTGAGESPLTACAPPLYPPPPLNRTVSVPSTVGGNSQEQRPLHAEQSSAPSSLPYNFQVDFSVPPPPISQTHSIPPHILSLLRCTASGNTTDNLLLNFSTSNVSQPHVSNSQEQTQIVPPTYPSETQVSQLNVMAPFQLITPAVSQPPIPANNLPPPDTSQVNRSHTLMPFHHLTRPNMPTHEPPPQISQHHMSTHHPSHSHIPTYHHYPPITPLQHVPLTDVPPTHGKSPHKTQQHRSHSRRVTEHSTPHPRSQNTEMQLYMAGSYKNSFSDPLFTNREVACHSSHDALRNEYNPWYKGEDCGAPSSTSSLPGMLNHWVPPPLQTPRSRPPPLPPPLPSPQQRMESPNQTTLSHLLAMPTPPPDQHDKALSPGTGNLYSGHGHSYQNYHGHQQYWNQQKTPPLRVPEYHQHLQTDTKRPIDTMVSRWSQDVPHRLSRYHVPALLRSEMNNSRQMDYDYRSSHHGHRDRIRCRGSRRGRNTTFSNPLHRQLTEVSLNTGHAELVRRRQCHDDLNDELYEKSAEACALMSAISAVQRTIGGAAAAAVGITATAGESPSGTPALPAPPVLPALPAPKILPALMATPWPSTAPTSTRQDKEDDSVEKRLCWHSRKNDEPSTDVSDQLTVPYTNPLIQNGDQTVAMTSQYRNIKQYMKGSFGDTLHVHQGPSPLSVPPKDPKTVLLPSTGQVMDVATRELNTGLLSSSGRLILPDSFPSVAPYLGLQSTPEDKEKFMKSFWMSFYQQQVLKLGLLPMLQPSQTQNADQLGTHLYQQMMGHKEFRHALAELDHQILARGSLGSAGPLAALPPGPSLHSSTADALSTYGSALAQHTQSGTCASSLSHQSGFLQSALQNTCSSAQNPALPSCSTRDCCSVDYTAEQGQRTKELVQLKVYQKQEFLRKSTEEPVGEVNGGTLRQKHEQLPQQQQRKNGKVKMKQLSEDLQKQVVQVHIAQQGRQPQIQEQTEKPCALKDAYCVPFLQQHTNEHGVIREKQHLETKPHQDANLQLDNLKAKRGRKRKSESLEQESPMQWATNFKGHRASQNSSGGGMQRSVIVHGKEYVNQMPHFTYQQQLHHVNSVIMKDSQRVQEKQEEQQKMPQLTQLLMQGQTETEIYQKGNGQKQNEAIRASRLAAGKIIIEPKQRKHSKMVQNVPDKETLHVQNLSTDLHVHQKIPEYIKQEPISSPTEETVTKSKEEQEALQNIWYGSAVNMARVAEDLQQSQLGVDLQRKSFSFNHHDARSSQLADGSQGLDLSCQKHVQKLVSDNITIKTEEDAEEICDQATNQQTQETFDLLEELDEIKLDTLQHQNTDQQQNLLELPSFGSYLNVDGMEEADVEEADLNAAYHAVVSLQQSEIPDVPATPPSHMTRTSEYCQSPMTGSTVSNLSRNTKQLNEDSCSSKVVQQVPVIQMPQRSPSPVSVQIKADTGIKGRKRQRKTLRRSRMSFEEEGETVPKSDCAHSSKCDSDHGVIPTLDEASFDQPLSFYSSAYKHTYTRPTSEAVIDAAMATVPVGVNTRNAAASRNRRAAMHALQKATHDIAPATGLAMAAKVATTSKAQAVLRGASTDSSSATDMTITANAFEVSDPASPSRQVQRTGRTVKRKYSRHRSKK